MLGKRSDQKGLWEADRLYLDYVGKHTFYGLLASLRGQLFSDDGVSLKDGVSKDRMPSVHDPEMRHGHKSSRRRFNGHKAAIVVDTDSQLITAVDVLPGNAPDNLGALELVDQSEASTGSDNYGP